jgi:hypothetical protein
MLTDTLLVLSEQHLSRVHAHRRQLRAEAERLVLVRNRRDRAPARAGRPSVASLVAPFRAAVARLGIAAAGGR